MSFVKGWTESQSRLALNELSVNVSMGIWSQSFQSLHDSTQHEQASVTGYGKMIASVESSTNGKVYEIINVLSLCQLQYINMRSNVICMRKKLSTTVLAVSSI